MKKQACGLLFALIVFSAPVLGQGWNVDLVGSLSLTSGQVYGVAQRDSYAYVARGSAGLSIVDVTDPANMVITGSLTGIGTAYKLVLAGSYVYVSTTPWGVVRIVDVSNPANPVLVNNYTLNGHFCAVDEERNLVFAEDGDVVILDISTPTNPVEISSFEPHFGGVTDLCLEGNYLYAQCLFINSSMDGWGSRVLVLDVSDPVNPRLVGQGAMEDQTCCIAVSDGYVYEVGYTTKFRILNVTDPTNPYEVSQLNFAGLPEFVSAYREYAFVTGDNGGGGHNFRVIDCSDPLNPTPSGYYDIPGWAGEVIAREELTYVAADPYLTTLNYSDATHNVVNVILTPLIQPIQIPASGGSFEFYLFAENNGPDAQPVDLWSKVIFPNGSVRSPVQGPVSVSLDSGTTGWLRHQNVPGSAPAGNYSYVVVAGNYPNSTWASDTLQFVKLATGDSPFIGDWNCSERLSTEFTLAPGGFKLIGAFPNPFNPSTAISYELRAASLVSLKIYDISGRLVATLVEGWRQAGEHEMFFDGSALVSGVYICCLRAGGEMNNRKLLLLK